MIDTDDSLGQIATTYPAATHVFLRHRLDFCCGGRQKLADACKRAGLNPDAIASEIAIEGETRQVERWDAKSLPEVIEFILTRYHEAHRRDLPVLLEAARRVERVHGTKPSCPHGLASAIEQMDVALRQHMYKEEEVLFPSILAGSRGGQIHMPIRVMMQEHDDHGLNLQRLREIATDFEPPQEACATWRALYSGLHKLESEIMEHIHLENNVLFARTLNAS